MSQAIEQTDNIDMNEASLLLDRAHAVIDSVFTLACSDHVEDLGSGSLASILDAAMVMIAQSKSIIDANPKHIGKVTA